MLNTHSPIEDHFTTHRAPKGGVAPLRRDLALHDYLERQQQARLDSAVGRPSVMSRIIAVVRMTKSLARRPVAARSNKFGLQR